MQRSPIAVVSFLVLAGCVTAPTPDGATDPDVLPVPTSLIYGDCDELLGAFPVQENAVPLPEGFAPAPFLGQGNGAVFVVGWECAAAHDSNNVSDATPFVEAFAAFSVTVPPELALDGAFAHGILLGLSTGSPLAAGAYEAWGLPVAREAVEFDIQGSTPLGLSGILSGPVGPLDVNMRVNAGGPNAPEAGSAVRFFAVEGNAVVAAYDIAWIDSDGLQGQALSTAALPGAPPATAGLGFYYTSDDPVRYTMTPFALPAVNATEEPAQ